MSEAAHHRSTALFVARLLLLALIAWIVYALVRALIAFIYLGAPFFDWQWYISIVSLLLLTVVLIVWPVPRPKLAWVSLVVLLIWAVVGYFGFWQSIRLFPAQSPPVTISFWGASTLIDLPESVLDDLRSTGGSLYIIVGAGAFDGEKGQALSSGLRRLAKHDIDVYLAVVASDYLSVPVYDEWITNVQTTAKAVRAEELTNVRGLIGDAEHPKHTPLDLLGQGRAEVHSATVALSDLIQFMQTEYPELSLGVTAEWPLYLDKLDGDADLSIVCRSPVDPPGNWGFINAMTYSSFVPSSWRAYYVYVIEQGLVRLYPEKQPSHLIGLLAQGRPGEPVIGLQDLARDAQLSRAMGVSEVVVFKLSDRVLEDLGLDLVRQLDRAVNEVSSDLTVEIAFSRPASMLVFGVLCGDALLDLFSWRALLLMGWVVLSGVMLGIRLRYTSKRAAREVFATTVLSTLLPHHGIILGKANGARHQP